MKTVASFLPAVAVLLFAGTQASAQQVLQINPGDVNIRSVDYDTQKTPEFGVSGVSSKRVPNPRDWLEVEVEFEVRVRGDMVVPELLFRYYVGFTDQAGQPRILTGDVRHVNVLLGERMHSAVYVAPSTLGEITGNYRRFQTSAVRAVGLEVIYNGVVVGRYSDAAGNQPFWQAAGTQPGVLSKTDTPFAFLWLDRYAEYAR